LPLRHSITFICQFLWVIHYWLPLRHSITFICSFDYSFHLIYVEIYVDTRNRQIPVLGGDLGGLQTLLIFLHHSRLKTWIHPCHRIC
jgi:hypothetical protein